MGNSIKKLLAGGVFLLIASSANAMTGGEFIKSDKILAIGYVAGVVEYVLNVGGQQDTKTMYEARLCFGNGKIDLQSAYLEVVTRIENDPSLVPYPAVVSVMKVLIDKCPEAWRSH